MDDWRRIDDPDWPAPKDESGILLAVDCGFHGYDVVSGYWHKSRECWWHGSSGIHGRVTHWMPLPTPPDGQQGKE